MNVSENGSTYPGKIDHCADCGRYDRLYCCSAECLKWTCGECVTRLEQEQFCVSHKFCACGKPGVLLNAEGDPSCGCGEGGK